MAADSLKSLSQLFDLSEAQRDGIFQDVAEFELAALQECGPEIAFGDGERARARQAVISRRLSEAQAAIHTESVIDGIGQKRHFPEMMRARAVSEDK